MNGATCAARGINKIAGRPEALRQMRNCPATMSGGHYGRGPVIAMRRGQGRLTVCRQRMLKPCLSHCVFLDELYAEVGAVGGSRWDTSCLLSWLERAGAVWLPWQDMRKIQWI